VAAKCPTGRLDSPSKKVAKDRCNRQPTFKSKWRGSIPLDECCKKYKLNPAALNTVLLCQRKIIIAKR